MCINLFLLNQQVDIHVFGGNATSSLTSSIYCLLRSFLAVGILIGFAYGGLVTGEAHSKHTQEILFSIFCSLSVAVSYHLSRSSSDPTVILSLIKRQLLVPPPSSGSSDQENDKIDPAKNNCDTDSSKQKKKETTVEIKESGNIVEGASPNAEETSGKKGSGKADELPSPTKSSAESTLSATATITSQDPLPKKLCDTVYARLKSDAIVCVCIAVITFLLHWSGFFRLLQPDLNYVLWVVAVIVGFFLHYVLPQLRKQLPWLCFSHPVLKSKEYGQFEVSISIGTTIEMELGNFHS